MNNFIPGDVVIRHLAGGEIGVVVRFVRTLGGINWYSVRFAGGEMVVSANGLTALDQDRDESVSSRVAGNLLPPAALKRLIIRRKVSMGIGDIVYSLGATRTTLYPYQYKPLLKLLVSPIRRILVADEVGLGKTIEAGFIALEKASREPESRIVIVCPATLRLKWQAELERRFGLIFAIPTRDVAIDRIARGIDPDEESPLRAIVSYEQVRSKAFVEALDDNAKIDLLVVDEAHRVRNQATIQAVAVNKLSVMASWVVYLTATPIMTSGNDLWSLLNTLAPGEFPTVLAYEARARVNLRIVAAERALQSSEIDGLKKALVELNAIPHCDPHGFVTKNTWFPIALNELRELIDASASISRAERVRRVVGFQETLFQLNLLSPYFTRTRRIHVHHDLARRQVVTAMRPLTDLERRAYWELSKAIFHEYQSKHGGWVAGLVLANYQAQLASSLSGAVRRLKLAVGDTFDDDPGDEAVYAGFQPDSDAPLGHEAIPRSVARVLATIDPDELEMNDSKWDAMRDVLDGKHSDPDQPPIGKVVIFAFYKPSLDVIGRNLARHGIQFGRIDGDVAHVDREAVVMDFKKNPDIRVLLSSQVGGEGIDLQFANAVVNWDLPWNPMQVEQRIGRIDRLGQQSPSIYVFNLALEGTIEQRILARLQERIQAFVRNIGDIEEILGPELRELHRRIFSGTVTEGNLDQEVDRILKVTEIRIADQGALENQMDELVGQEQFLTDKVQRLKGEGRYVSSADLRFFVEDCLGSVDAKSSITYEGGGAIAELRAGTVLQERIQRTSPRASKEWRRFLTRCRAPVRVAFGTDDSEVPADVEILGVHHPLIRTLVGAMGGTQESIVAFHSSVATAEVEPGQYVMIVSANRDRNHDKVGNLLAIAIEIEHHGSVDWHAADALLTTVIAEGGVSNCLPSAEVRRSACDFAVGEMAARVDAWQRQRTDMRANQNARLRAAVESDLRGQMAAKRRQILEAESPGASDGQRRILPMWRADLVRLERELDRRLVDVDSGTSPDWENVLIAAGIISVFGQSSLDRGEL